MSIRLKQDKLQLIVQAAKDRFALDLDGLHGIAHWQRVCENGVCIAKHTGADHTIVELFAFLHDCCRVDNSTDRGHGARAAEFAETLRGSLICLEDAEFGLLFEAIRDHELGYTKADNTVQACWDADRLDLGRVGMRPDPRYLCTDFAKQKSTIAWGYERSLCAF